MWLQTLFDFISESWQTLAPWIVVDEFEAGVMLRLGRFQRPIRPGLNFKWPVVEKPILTNVAYDTKHNYSQTLTTNDGITVSFSSVVGYSIENPKKFLIETEDAESVVSDCVMSEAANLVPAIDYAQYMEPGFNESLLAKAKARAR